MSGSDIVVAGHLFSSSGMGEQARAGLRALRAAGLAAAGYDIFHHVARSDPDMRSLLIDTEARSLASFPIRVFHINGDEVEAVLSHLADKGESFSSGYNIIVPAWELPIYPSVWCAGLACFNEIWAISSFVQKALEAAGLSAYYVGQSVEVNYKTYLPRRFFDISESAFSVLSMFDTASYVDRKNPWAVIRLLKALTKRRPFDDIQLIIKARVGEKGDELMRELREEVPIGSVVLTNSFETFATRSLIHCVDCFASLHRSEGFGRGLAEAMLADRLALATGWSGNCDYMAEGNSLFVQHVLVPVEEAQYPQWQGQCWAEPDVDHSLYLLLKAIDDPTWARQIRRLGRRSAEQTAKNRPIGLRMLQRVEEIRQEQKH